MLKTRLVADGEERLFFSSSWTRLSGPTLGFGNLWNMNPDFLVAQGPETADLPSPEKRPRPPLPLAETPGRSGGRLPFPVNGAL